MHYNKVTHAKDIDAEIKLVTGTGRSGTSAMMKLLHNMGFTDTTNCYFNKKVMGGLELALGKGSLNSSEIDFNNLPPIIKDPRFTVQIQQIMKDNPKLKINKALVCVRELEKSAKSRLKKGLNWYQDESMPEAFGKSNLQKQIVFNQRILGNFLCQCAIFDIPLVLIEFPRFVYEKEYTYRKLCEFLDYEIELELFNQHFASSIKKKYITVK